MDNNPQYSEPPKRQRAWLRYSLKALLCCVTIACVWLGVWAGKAHQQRAAVRAIRELGGRVTYDHQDQSGIPWEAKTMPSENWLEGLLGVDFFHPVTMVALRNVPLKDADLAWLQGLDDLEYLMIDQTKITDDGLKYLWHLNALKDLHLSGSQISGAGLAYLAPVKSLEGLFLSGCPQITDSNMEYLGQLANLRQLSLEDTSVSDRGVQEIANLHNLECLYLSRTQFTDEGIKHLTGLKKLFWLRISKGQLTDAGKAELQKAFEQREFPKLRIDEASP
jgi:hypothetical protein